jgi:hypothetical protein
MTKLQESSDDDEPDYDYDCDNEKTMINNGKMSDEENDV